MNDEEIRECVEKNTESILHALDYKFKNDLRNWGKFVISLLVIILAAWWTLGELFSERPTEARVEKIVDQKTKIINPTIKEELKDHDNRIHLQQRQLDRIEQKLENVQDSIDEIKEKINK